MNIFKRIRNLWRISTIEMPKKKSEIRKSIESIIKPHAKIVEMDNPLDNIKL